MQKIEWTEKRIALKDLKPYPRNPRRISKQAFERLKKSLRALGYHQRIVCQPDGTIAGGHQRLEALKELGFDSVACLVPSRTLTDKEFQQLMVQDNLNFGEFDFDILGADFDLGDLVEWGMDEKLLVGFETEKKEFLTDEDEVPEAADKPKSVLGDVWLLGKHRLMCGDCTLSTNAARLFGELKPNLMVTDPPYGVNYDPTRTSNNKNKAGKVLNDDRADWTEAWSLFTGDVAYVWHANLFTSTVLSSLENCGFEHRAMIIWAKDRMTFGRGHYHWQHEPAWYVVRKGKNGNWCGGRDKTTLWQIKAREDNGHGHGTQKPVECMKRPIENNSNIGDLVYDPFLGSGTTLIAAEKTGRICLGFELNPIYCDVIIKRWQAFTGLKAVHEQSGKAFDDIN